jgi:hypothetical protein
VSIPVFFLPNHPKWGVEPLPFTLVLLEVVLWLLPAVEHCFWYSSRLGIEAPIAAWVEGQPGNAVRANPPHSHALWATARRPHESSRARRPTYPPPEAGKPG